MAQFIIGYAFNFLLIIGKISIKGNNKFTDKEILKIMEIKTGKEFNEKKINKGITSIIKLYSNNGYPFCKIKPFGFNINGDTISFGLNIDEGNFVKINKIDIIGNDVTKDYVIIRESKINYGEIFCVDKIHNAEKRVNALSFISFTKIEPTNDGVIITIKENKNNYANGIFGYARNSFLGIIDFAIDNLFGTGRSFSISYKKLRDYEFMSLNYLEPYIFNLPINFKFNFTARENKTYKENSTAYKILFPIIYYFTPYLNYKISNVTVVEPMTKIKNDYLLLGVEGNSEKINYDINVEFKKTKVFSSKSFISFLFYFPLQLNLFCKFNYFNIFKNNVPIYEKFLIGGNNTIRGFYEEEIICLKAIWLNNEIKFNYKFTTLIIFDFALIDGQKIKTYGIGIEFKNNIKIIYAVPTYLPFSDGKLHISISHNF